VKEVSNMQKKQTQKFRWGIKTPFVGFIHTGNQRALEKIYGISAPNHIKALGV